MSTKFLVKGRVQGVGFRYFTSYEAQKLGLTGYARNLENGDVEVLACGKQESIDALHKWLYQGSPHANVTSVQASQSDEEVLRGFKCG